jgi:hypothetical protein
VPDAGYESRKSACGDCFYYPAVGHVTTVFSVTMERIIEIDMGPHPSCTCRRKTRICFVLVRESVQQLHRPELKYPEYEMWNNIPSLLTVWLWTFGDLWGYFRKG